MSDYNFDDIRPYNDDEVPAAIQRIVLAKKVKSLIAAFMTEKQVEAILGLLPQVKTVDEFQHNIIKNIVDGVMARAGASLYAKNVKTTGSLKASLFISNHRDIILDPTFLGYVLHTNGHSTVEIAIGNNLLIEPWIEDLVRVNKSFIVRRDVQGRELLMASKKMSAYIRHAVTNKRSNVWIAQREGRAKDGNDATQIALLKMLHMGAGNISPVQSFQHLNMVPVSITYEYDPCDVLKARELYMLSTGAEYVKTAGDDLLSMKWGLLGLAGRVCYTFAPEIDHQLLPEDADLQTSCEILAREIDKHIYAGYELFPSHFYSYDMYFGGTKFSKQYNQDKINEFETLIDKKTALLLPAYAENQEFRKFVYLQYANVLKNAISVRPDLMK
jgi:hypothetical protein